jgi:putative aldouronate transport system substrate-binding protein
MKKAVSMSVATVLISSLLLSACSDNKEATKPDNKAATDNINSAGIFPIVKEKVTLKVLMSGSPRVEDYNTNEFTKWLEEKTNVHVDWEVVPAAQADQKLNLMLASGTYPDIILGFAVTPTKQLIYGSQGIFKPLNELIDKYGPETKKVLADMPEVKKAITAADGKVYSLPNINACYHCSMSYKILPSTKSFQRKGSQWQWKSR